MKNIIFDLGGVVVPVYEQLTFKSFVELTSKPSQNQTLQEFYRTGIPLYETGHLSDSELVDQLQEILYSPGEETPTKEEIIEAWNMMIPDFPEENIQLLKDLSKRFRLFLLSNTNTLHMKFLNDLFHDAHGIDADWTNLFEKAYFSYEIGLRKPDPAAFEYVLEHSQLVASETLFVDDRNENIAVATKLGLQTMLHHTNYPLTLSLFE